MIVMKFGGTSLQDEPAISRSIRALKASSSSGVVVVLSAVGKTTNRLLMVGELATRGTLDLADSAFRDLKGHHLQLVRDLLPRGSRKETLLGVESLFAELQQMIERLPGRAFSPRYQDAVASLGERLSTWIFAQALLQRGHAVCLLDSRQLIRTDDRFTKATVDRKITFARIREKVLPALERHRTIVLQGFIGATREGVPTTIGRGGSDLTASLVAAALDAERIEIWTDVPGILTADPRIVPNAYKIREISFDEASELAYFGAKVLHPATLLPAIERQIPVQVCDSGRVDLPGTRISFRSPPSGTPVKSIACKAGISLINIHSTRMLLAYGFLKRIFEVFDRHQTVVDVVATSEVAVSVTVDSTENLEAVRKDLMDVGRVSVEPGMAIICVVGEKLKDTPGIAARVFRAVEPINVHMISQGASRINVTFLVKEEKMKDAVRLLHDEFFQTVDKETFEAVARGAC